MATLEYQNSLPSQLTFRKTLLFYLKQNAKPRVLLKLMQIAKYFCFKEFPFLVVKNLGFYEQKWGYLELGATEWEGNFWGPPGSKPLNFWVTNWLIIEGDADYDVSDLIREIAVCDPKCLDLEDHEITLDEFKFLTSKLTVQINLDKTIIRDNHGNILPLETILECVPWLQDVYFVLSEESALTLTLESTQNVIKFLMMSQIKTFGLREVPETFDFVAFSEFLQERKPQIYVSLQFSDDISDLYKQKLQAYIKKMATEGFDKCHPIVLKFDGQTWEAFDDLRKNVRIHLYGYDRWP